MSEAKALEWFTFFGMKGVTVGLDEDSVDLSLSRAPEHADALDYAAARLEATAREMRAKAASLRPPLPRCPHGHVIYPPSEDRFRDYVCVPCAQAGVEHRTNPIEAKRSPASK